MPAMPSRLAPDCTEVERGCGVRTVCEGIRASGLAQRCNRVIDEHVQDVDVVDVEDVEAY